MKNHDGSIQMLTDVRYIQSLKKNIILLGVLKSKVLTITRRDEFLKVLTRALIMMKGTKRNNLYYFQGSIVYWININSFWKRCRFRSNQVVAYAFETCWWKSITDFDETMLTEGANSCNLEFCKHCVLGKQTIVKFS